MEEDPNAAAWSGDAPPFHHPVFVLTHHPRPTEAKQGATTVTFVTGGIADALECVRVGESPTGVTHLTYRPRSA